MVSNPVPAPLERIKRSPIEPGEAHVLVVEDNVANFVLIARLLAYAGVKDCQWKTTGWGVVEFALNMGHVDLVLMDLRLPHESGYDALATIRAHPRLAATPVIAVTAQANRTELEKARLAGFDGFLTKPLDVDRFPEQIGRIMQGEAIWEIGF